MAVIVLYTICLALLTVGLTGGLYVSSLGDGLLSPLRLWLERYGRSGKLWEQYIYDKQLWEKAASELKDRNNLDALESAYKTSRRKWAMYALWRKPLLLCMYCMPSIYGVVLGVLGAIFYDLPWVSIPLAVPMATLINNILIRHINQ